ncbi:MAG: endolytic transglycosylase MltG, partial [Actinobacteria bacterium]|nr:endolytic transglycosylase MltG [Actinomycetota bacterium]NIU64135.1 endolytic transglycosylase MltG [Actinomycetota bacterium]NIW25936.1 hypothetical protein [Actinomycetota bacterium]
ERQTPYTFEELTGALLDGTITSSLLPEPAQALRDWEGLLFPDTYEFEADASIEDILGRLVSTTE